jgi:hypothetical protein
MVLMLRAVVVVALAVYSVPAVAAGQEISADSLLRRIDLLEQKTADLERRVHELEARVTVSPSRPPAVPPSAQWRDIQNWRRLRHGMTMDQVRTLLGEPERVEAGSRLTFWRWGGDFGAHVQLDSRSGKVESWSEPRR